MGSNPARGMDIRSSSRCAVLLRDRPQDGTTLRPKGSTNCRKTLPKPHVRRQPKFRLIQVSSWALGQLLDIVLSVYERVKMSETYLVC